MLPKVSESQEKKSETVPPRPKHIYSFLLILLLIIFRVIMGVEAVKKDLGLISSRVLHIRGIIRGVCVTEARGRGNEGKGEGQGRGRHIWESNHGTEQEKGPAPGLNLAATTTYFGAPAPRLFSYFYQVHRNKTRGTLLIKT